MDRTPRRRAPGRNARGWLLCLALAPLVGCAGAEPPAAESFVGTWERALPGGHSRLVIEQASNGYRVTWAMVDGPKSVRCVEDGRCDEFFAGTKVYEWRLRAYERPESADLFVESTGTPMTEAQPHVSWVDRLVMQQGGREVLAYLISKNGEEQDPPGGPLRLRRVDDGAL